MSQKKSHNSTISVPSQNILSSFFKNDILTLVTKEGNALKYYVVAKPPSSENDQIFEIILDNGHDKTSIMTGSASEMYRVFNELIEETKNKDTPNGKSPYVLLAGAVIGTLLVVGVVFSVVSLMHPEPLQSQSKVDSQQIAKLQEMVRQLKSAPTPPPMPGQFAPNSPSPANIPVPLVKNPVSLDDGNSQATTETPTPTSAEDTQKKILENMKQIQFDIANKLPIPDNLLVGLSPELVSQIKSQYNDLIGQNNEISSIPDKDPSNLKLPIPNGGTASRNTDLNAYFKSFGLEK